MKLSECIKDAFSGYAAMTIQQRALTDARDNIKPSARMCFYAQKEAKIDSAHPIQPSPSSVGECIKNYYMHGTDSCYRLLARYGKEYVMRYPLEDFHGSTGSLHSANSEAAERYTKMRLNKLGDNLFKGLEKDTIELWFDNFSNTKKFPSVLPSLGFYNIVNGSMGVACGVSSSIPQFSLKETNEAMIKLLNNPDIPFEEIYCAPDFISGGTILNGDEVKASLKAGRGRACCIRSTIDYDSDKNILIVKEIPFGVFTNTICGEIEQLVNNEEIHGIDKILDLTKKTPNIEIHLSKRANYLKVLKTLYKKTSLQSYYSINMMMLDKGTTPKIFGWKEALQAHLDHEIEVRTRAHKFDLIAIDKRINIIDGLLVAIANIDEVVRIIRSSNDKNEAKDSLIKRFGYNDEQVEAILKMTLSKLIHLEIQSFNDEKNKLIEEKEYHELALSDNGETVKQETIADLKEIAEKYGDSRRTKVINLDFSSEEDDAEPIEEKELLIYYTNHNNLYTQETTTLINSRRGTRGSKVKLGKDEFIVQTISDNNLSEIFAFTNTGKMYSAYTSNLPINSRISCAELFNLEDGEQITTLTTLARQDKNKYLIFITKNGIIKKTEISEYQKRRGKSIKAINLKDDDEVLKVFSTDKDKIGLLTSDGNYIIIETDNITATGRATAGVKAIKLNNDATVIDSQLIKDNDKTLVIISKNGLIKRTKIDEIGLSSRATKGKRIQKLNKNDFTIKVLSIDTDCDIIINTKERIIRINSSEISLLSREAAGVKSMKLNENEQIRDMLRGGQ